MTHEILAYISSNGRKLSVGYKLTDGKIIRLFRKIDGADLTAINNAIQETAAKGAKNVLLEVYRRNGSAYVKDREFLIPSEKIQVVSELKTLGNAPTLFEAPKVRPVTLQPSQPIVARPIQSSPTPTTPTQNHRPMQSQSWEQYALKEAQDKIAELKAENKSLSAENRSLDLKVRDFEKEMLKKDFEIEKAVAQVQSQGGVNGFLDKASQNPLMMNTIAGIAQKMLGLPMDMQPSLSTSPELDGAGKPEQMAANIRIWLSGQPEPIQDKFYELVMEITKSKDFMNVVQRLINVVKKPSATTLDADIQIAN